MACGRPFFKHKNLLYTNFRKFFFGATEIAIFVVRSHENETIKWKLWVLLTTSIFGDNAKCWEREKYAKEDDIKQSQHKTLENVVATRKTFKTGLLTRIGTTLPNSSHISLNRPSQMRLKLPFVLCLLWKIHAFIAWLNKMSEGTSRRLESSRWLPTKRRSTNWYHQRQNAS